MTQKERRIFLIDCLLKENLGYRIARILASAGYTCPPVPPPVNTIFIAPPQKIITKIIIAQLAKHTYYLISYKNVIHAPIAQLDRVTHYECGGWGFDSLWVYQRMVAYPSSLKNASPLYSRRGVFLVTSTRFAGDVPVPLSSGYFGQIGRAHV